MKKLFYIILLIANSIPVLLSQKIGNLNGIYYQAVAIDDVGKEIVGSDITGKPLYQKAIGVRFTITKGLNGAVQWEETHTTNTDKYGLFNLIIGKGTPTANRPFARLLDIPWIDADQFLKVELSIKNDGNFKLVSNQQFMTVPYSFYTDDIADDAITTFKILDSAILNRDINTSAVDSRTILNETIQAQDIDTGAVTTSEILDSTILNRDLQTAAVDSRVILDSSIFNIDIRTAAVDSRTILDSTILNRDIQTGAVDSRTILDSTIINIDIHNSAVDSRTILDSTILNRDIQTGVVDSRTILDSTISNIDIRTAAINSRTISDASIMNEDIQDFTIDLTKKVTGILPLVNGGTGNDSLIRNSLLIGNGKGPILSLGQPKEAQIPIGVSDSMPPKLKVLAGGSGVKVTITADSIILSSGISGIFSVIADTLDIGEIASRLSWVSPPIELIGVDLGAIIHGSLNVDLSGAVMSTYVSAKDTIRVSIFNGTAFTLNLGEQKELRVMVMK